MLKNELKVAYEGGKLSGLIDFTYFVNGPYELIYAIDT